MKSSVAIFVPYLSLSNSAEMVIGAFDLLVKLLNVTICFVSGYNKLL